jgi:hypothetical protein
MTEPRTPDALRERIAQQEANLVNIVAQTLIADDGNWRDVLDNIRHMAEGRFDSASPSILADSNKRIDAMEVEIDALARMSRAQDEGLAEYEARIDALQAQVDALTAERDEARADAAMWELHDTQQGARCVVHLKELAACRAVVEEAAFLIARLEELEISDEMERDFYGHVVPPMERLRSLLTPTADREGTDSGGTHDWFQADKLPFVSCRKCGIVRRADGQNKPCKGVVTVGPRGTDSGRMEHGDA